MRWNADLAYAVGIITTDGYLSSDKRHVSITSTDSQLLQNIKRCLKKKNSITRNPPSCIGKKTAYRLQLGDVKFYRWLEKIGLHTKKSLSIGPLKISKLFFRDFLRGHLDGDGSIVHYTDRYLRHLNKNYVYDRLFVYFISASRIHIQWLRDNIARLTKLKGSLNTRISKSQQGRHPTIVLKFSTKEAKVLLNWIYYKQNLPCLARKFKIAKPYLTK